MYGKGKWKGTVRFSVAAANGAQKVALAGNFNSWQPAAMKQQKDGRFALELRLPPGIYEYKFIVDGTWMADPDHSHWAPNAFGSFNSVAQVE
jgi:1,4-alpha-glucan branching enzyme